MAELDLRPVWPGFARCVRCRHIFLIEMLRFEFSQLWCPWCLEQRPGLPHRHEDPATCDCRFLAGRPTQRP